MKVTDQHSMLTDWHLRVLTRLGEYILDVKEKEKEMCNLGIPDLWMSISR